MIGSPGANGTDGVADTTDDEWIMDTFIAGVTRMYLPATDGNNIDGALYNPSAEGLSVIPGGSNDVFFTTATLEMIFDATPVLDEDSTFVRMQNVGNNGAGSLKLDGVPDPDPEPIPIPIPIIPEPKTAMVVMLALVVLMFSHRRVAGEE